jgi:hypothetical protein
MLLVRHFINNGIGVSRLLLGCTFFFIVPAFVTAEVSDVQQAVAAIKQEFSKREIIIGGYIKPEAIWDSRQVNGLRDDQLLFFPEFFLGDAVGRDCNKAGQFSIFAIQTRINMTMKGPQVRSAQGSGFIEGDFFATSDATINSFRMRHAFMRLDWKKTTLLMGQTWHPIFVDDCVPETISFNTGAPFESFSLNPQVRLEQQLSDRWKLLVALIAEGNFSSDGPAGQSSAYFRDSMVPLINAQLRRTDKKFMAGVGVDVRSLKPRLVSANNYKVDERINSVSAFAYATFTHEPAVLKLKFLFASNPYSYLMLGGYGIKSVDPVTDKRTYTNIRNLDIWLEFIYGKVLQPALFAGFIKNIGSHASLAPVNSVPDASTFADLIYGRGATIDWMLRVSPRFNWNHETVTLTAELEVTHARFGTITQYATVCPNDPETNVRLLLAGFYNF